MLSLVQEGGDGSFDGYLGIQPRAKSLRSSFTGLLQSSCTGILRVVSPEGRKVVPDYLLRKVHPGFALGFSGVRV